VQISFPAGEINLRLERAAKDFVIKVIIIMEMTFLAKEKPAHQYLVRSTE
jgi:hypothetical protein